MRDLVSAETELGGKASDFAARQNGLLVALVTGAGNVAYTTWKTWHYGGHASSGDNSGSFAGW